MGLPRLRLANSEKLIKLKKIAIQRIYFEKRICELQVKQTQ